MKRMQIKTKVTLWYTSFMIVLMVIILGLLLFYSQTAMERSQRTHIIKEVEEQIEDLLDGEEISYFEDGVYMMQYGANGEYQQGYVPKGFDVTFPLQDGGIQQPEGTDFYTYDRSFVDEGGNVFWIRGVVSNQETLVVNRIFLGAFFIFIPMLVLLSSVVGYFITKRAFYPIRKIQETAEKIADSNELSTRIGLPPGKDEISKLGHTFDVMLERLEQSFEKEKQFTSDASHELRTPISVILTESEYSLQHVDMIEEAKESMEVIHRQANRMSQLVNHLLFLARTDAKTMELQYQSVNIAQVLKEVLEEFYEEAKESHLTMTMEQEGEETVIHTVDPLLFRRVLQNLIQNAISYTNPGGRIWVTLRREEDTLVIQVKDNGIGISEENLVKIWDRFFQVNQARSKHCGSMGLGLSMVKWIMEKHGGNITVSSKEGEGSTFTVYFPEIKKYF